VFFGQAKACVVPRAGFETMQELNPQIGKTLKVIEASAPLLTVIVLLTDAVTERDRLDIKRSALQVHNSTEGRQMLSLIGKDRMVDFKPSDLIGIEALVEDYDSRKAKTGQSK
jgi:hypothetical protein